MPAGAKGSKGSGRPGGNSGRPAAATPPPPIGEHVVEFKEIKPHAEVRASRRRGCRPARRRTRRTPPIRRRSSRPRAPSSSRAGTTTTSSTRAGRTASTRRRSTSWRVRPSRLLPPPRRRRPRSAPPADDDGAQLQIHGLVPPHPETGRAARRLRIRRLAGVPLSRRATFVCPGRVLERGDRRLRPLPMVRAPPRAGRRAPRGDPPPPAGKIEVSSASPTSSRPPSRSSARFLGRAWAVAKILP